jgi:hypothetical protein
MKIDVKTSPFFPWTINIMGIALVFSAGIVIFFHFLIGLALLIGSALIFTTHYRLMIDLDQRVYHDYVWIMGMKHGKPASFEKIDYLFIKKSHTVQNMYARVYTTTLRKDVYDAYLRFSETKKIHLVTRESKHRLVKQVKSLAAQLGVEVIDYTDGEGKTL